MSVAAFESVEPVADAVMYEGYVLYPYRASAMKNRFRWQFGVVAPRAYSDGRGSDSWYAQTECLVECGSRARLTVKVRCLQLQRRNVDQPSDADSGGWRACDRIVAGGHQFLAWDEAVPRAIASPGLPLDALCIREHTMQLDLAPARQTEIVHGGRGEPVARITRERWPVSAVVRIRSERVGLVQKVRVRVENVTSWTERAACERDVALRQSLLGCHTLLHMDDGRFVSLIDPSPHAAAAARSCVNEHTWPVLAGAPGSRDVMLSAPIVLDDYPAIAPESRGAFFDATEIDEMLALRVMTMTDEEKAEAAATDERAGAIVQRTGGPDDASLHGAIRSLAPHRAFEELLNPAPESAPERAFVEVDSVRLSAGSRVRLAPQKRGDSMDMFLAGRAATVAAVYRDLEDRAYLAVTLDDDPGADLQQSYGRFFYFSPHEVRPLDLEADGDRQR